MAVSQLDLAQARLTSPLPMISDLFRAYSASLAAQLSIEKKPMEMFEESKETSRLALGLDEGRYPAYGMHRRFRGGDNSSASGA